MNRVTLFSVLALAALLIAACGGVAAAPEATLESSQPETVAMDSDVNKSDDGSANDDADETMSVDSDMAGDDDTMHDADQPMSEDKDMADDDDAMLDADEPMSVDSDMADDDDAMHDEDQPMSEDKDMADDNDAMHDEDEPMSEDKNMADDDTMSSEAGDDGDAQTMTDLPPWFTAELTDVNSGETFTIADLNDQVLLVETMAIWCSNCLRQQKEVKLLHEALADREGWATVVLDIDPNEKEGDLQAYTAKHDFDWTYAVAPREVAREIGQLYGDQFLNPPSTPMLVIDSQGDVHLLPFGRKDASDLQESIESFLDGEG